MNGALRVEIGRASRGEARVRVTAGSTRHEAPFRFGLAPFQWEELRWYLEDYPRYPRLRSEELARRLETGITRLAVGLFDATFASAQPIRELWRRVAARLPETRIEIACLAPEFDALPWELMTDSDGRILSMSARAFLRVAPSDSPPSISRAGSDDLRVLFVIARPRRGRDVPLRSVALHVVRGSSARGMSVAVLRPATEAALRRELEDAADRGSPYDVVHFDGHGLFGAPSDDAEPKAAGPAGAGGPRGYVLMEADLHSDGASYLDGADLGALLVDNGVRVLVLNACRSGYQPADAPRAGDEPSDEPARAFGSLAVQAASAGVPGIVAMRYDVYVATAAAFVGHLYHHIGSGRDLAASVTLARRDLARPVKGTNSRWVAKGWAVPVIYEAGGQEVAFATRGAGPAPPASSIPGVVGRDDVIFALDRGLLDGGVALLRGWAGIGKTATSTAFVDWYRATGALSGPTLRLVTPSNWTAGDVMSQLANGLRADSASSDAEPTGDAAAALGRRLGEAGALVVWDVRTIAEQRGSTLPAARDVELVNLLLCAAVGAGCRVIVESRMAVPWVDAGPLTFGLEPMAYADQSYEMVNATLIRAGAGAVREPRAVFPVIQFSQGIPRTLTSLAAELMSRHLTSAAQPAVREYADRLEAGVVRVPDNPWQPEPDRFSGLEVLAGNFLHRERQVVGLLWLFRGVAWAGSIVNLGDGDYGLPAVRALGLDGVVGILRRGVELGLLSEPIPHSFFIHPGAVSDLRELFSRSFDAAGAAAAERAWVEQLGHFGGDVVARAFDPVVFNAVLYHERNLVVAWQVAIDRGWPAAVEGTLLGLRTVFRSTGRSFEWQQVLDATSAAAAREDRAADPDWAPVRHQVRGLVAEMRDFPGVTRL